MEFGDPIQVPPELLEKYKAGGACKVEAGNELLAIIEDAHHDVTIQVADQETRRLIWTLRRLYASGVRRSEPTSPDSLSAKEQKKNRFQIVRALAEGYDKVKHNPQVQELVKKAEKYRYLLDAYGVRDYQVEKRLNMQGSPLALLAWRVLLVLLFLPLCIPVLALASPWFLVTKIISRIKAKEALAASSVKIAGRDVVATWKVIWHVTFLHTLREYRCSFHWSSSPCCMCSTPSWRIDCLGKDGGQHTSSSCRSSLHTAYG